MLLIMQLIGNINTNLMKLRNDIKTHTKEILNTNLNIEKLMKKSNIIPTPIVMGWFGILLIVVSMLTGCEKENDCKTYRCGDREVNSINYGSYYKYDECECIEKF